MQLKGKQIKDNSVEQNKLNVTTESITNISSVTNAEYVNNNAVNRVESLNYATLNMNMLANNATIGDLACDIPIIEFPISNTQVKINNINVTVGVGKDCYFSPDGIEIRTGGQAEKDDLLYWNSTRFNLESDDEIDFIYITAKETLELAENTTITLDPYYPALNVKYTGTDGTSMNITIDGVSFTVGNVAGDFVWDIGGVNETTMTIKGESIVQVVNGEDYTIWFDGFGSLLYSVKKGLFDIEIISIFGTGFDEECSKVLNLDDGRILAIGKFTEYNGNPFDGIVLLNKNGTVDNTFIQGTGFDNSAGIGNSPVFNNMIQDTGGKIVIIGYFTEYNGSAINGIIRLNTDGTIDNTLIQGTGFIGSGNSIIEDSNGKYVIGGNVTSYNGVSVKKAFRIFKDGSIDSTFNTLAGFNGTVNVIIEDINNQYIFGGAFTEFNTYTIVSLVRLNQDGSIDPTLVTSNGGLEGGVSTIIEDSDGNYMIGGDMTLYDRVTWVNGVIRIAKNGDVITSFVQGTGFNDTVKTVIEYDNKYYFGGRFTEYNDTKVKSFVVLNKDGSIDTQFNTNLSTDLSDYMVVNDMKLLSNNNICMYMW